MKKKEDMRIVQTFKRIFNVRAWFDYERIKSFTVYLSTGVKKLFVPQQQKPDQSFSQVVQKLKLTEADITGKENSLWRLSMLMLVIAGLIFVYAVYSLCRGHLVAGTLSFVIMSVALAVGFRYHFWYFQISQRKLGCTIKEWYTKGLRGGRS